ncbi:MAG: hypothetical protein K2Y51_02730 [Gammaproteobacteria bacterium]|nr:hypothetical protein [Gammaproteobacteria bacterium]
MATDLHRVMHGVAIRKHGDAAAVAGLAGLPLAKVQAVLAGAVTGGRVAEVDGKYMLTPCGQMMLAGEYSRFNDALRANADFIAAYQRFEVINKDLKQVITDWQTLEVGGKRVANDHSNKAYDAQVIGKLGDLHERFEPILKKLCAGEPRLKVYSDKLTAALEKAEDGDIAWVSDAKLDSYHTVWFELHEDLLRLTGNVREE